MALTWPHGQKGRPINLGGQFATLEEKGAVGKYCCFDEIHTTGSKLLNSCPKVVKSLSCCSICFHNESSHHHHCTIMLIKCKLLQWHNYNSNMLNHHEKHKSYKNLVSMLIHDGLIFTN